MPRSAAEHHAAWADLTAELDLWGESGRLATFWWRDDDAVAATPRLHDLFSVAEGAPIALAVIPQRAQPELSAVLESWPNVAVLQHGWQHANHAEQAKKSEFPEKRRPAVVRDELALGRARLAALFARRALAIFVPPWNRFAECFLPVLQEAGLIGISGMRGGRRVAPRPGIARADVHVDLVAWRAGGGFVGTEPALGHIVAHLRRRRRGEAEPGEATGILTHHLVTDRAALAFLARFGGVLSAHPAAAWIAPEQLFVCR